MFMSLWLFCCDWTQTGLKWIAELKLIFWLRHNLEGKCDNIPYFLVFFTYSILWKNNTSVVQ